MSTYESEDQKFRLFPVFLIAMALTFAIVAASYIIPAKRTQKEYPNQLTATVVNCERGGIYLTQEEDRKAVYNYTLTVEYSFYGNEKQRVTIPAAVKSERPVGSTVEIACSEDGRHAVMASDARVPGGGYLFVGAAILMLVLIPVSFYFSKQSSGF